MNIYAGKDWRQEEKRTTEDKVVGWHHQLNGHESEQAPGDGEGQESLACCGPCRTQLSDWTTTLCEHNVFFFLVQIPGSEILTGGWKSEVRVPIWSGSMRTPPTNFLTWQRDWRHRAGSYSFFRRLIAFMRAPPSWPNGLPKSPPANTLILAVSSVQFSSVAQSCLTLCDPMDCSMPGLPLHHQFPESTETHVHWVSNAIQPSHPLPSPSSPALNFPQHQGLFKWVRSSHQVATVLEFQL